MAKPTRQQVADQLNKLQAQGASDQAISAYVASTGYVDTDFNIDMSGNFSPMTVGTGTVTTSYTAAELTQSNQFYQSLASTASVAKTTTTSFQQSTGGGSTTVTSLPPIETPQSLTYKQDANQALELQKAYALNPDGKFGRKILDKKLADGTISQAQYNEIVSSTPEQRVAKSLDYSAQYQTLSQKAIDTQINRPPEVTVTTNPNNSSITVASAPLASSTNTASSPEITQQEQRTAPEFKPAVTDTNSDPYVNTATGTSTIAPQDNVDDGSDPYVSQGATTIPLPQPQEPVPPGPTSAPYDELGNLNPGWGLDENGNPVWIAPGYIDATGQNISDKQTPPEIEGPAYDDNGNLMPGWGLDENGNPVWVAPGYIDATGETIQAKQTPSEIQGPAYDDNGNLMPGWGLDENGNPVWIAPGYIDATGETIQAKQTPTAIEGPAYDDEGNLMPGWSLDENNNPVWVGNNPDGTLFVEPATQASADQSRAAAAAAKARGTTAAEENTQGQASAQDQVNALAQGDWRVRLQLAPGADYLYKSKQVPGILFPLVATQGVLFPYTPSISVSYAASYDATDLLHSNYKIYQYKSSSVDTISITCDFTAQDTFEANYLLAVIHFFRSVTKMFYGQDQNPTNGTPPPLCYLTGMGAYQFDKHPLAITAFNYSLPTDVDYIQAGSTATAAGSTTQETNSTTVPRQGTAIDTGGNPPAAKFKNTPTGTTEPTYVPTKIQLAISAIPIVSRNDISNNFSLRDYASGSLLRGSKNRGGAGIW